MTGFAVNGFAVGGFAAAARDFDAALGAVVDDVRRTDGRTGGRWATARVERELGLGMPPLCNAPRPT
ncbi:MAG: hypothetical protein MUF53_05095 [Gemmatimonadaceae bacterium]|nr:hypothetical protein [Gemmatimonadaceae bacterium]